MKRIGIVGGGQLARMLALAGRPLGLDFLALDPAVNAPAACVARPIVAAFDDPVALAKLAEASDVVTYEFENLSAQALEGLARIVTVRPGTHSLMISQDRINEKQMFASLGLPTAPYRAVETLADLKISISVLGCPAILKTRRFGYDGKGQSLIRQEIDADSAWSAVAGCAAKAELILEGFVPFQYEVSQISCRGIDGAIVHYPLSENVHAAGILRRSIPLAEGLNTSLVVQARQAMERLLVELDHVGVLCIEFFVVGTDLIVNEMAPRVHNSGHWSIDGGGVSQFENHVRAVVGLPLGNPATVRPVAMINLIGAMPPLSELLQIPGVRVHDYDKEPRPDRKVGHLNLLADSPSGLRASIEAVADYLPTDSRDAVLRPSIAAC